MLLKLFSVARDILTMPGGSMLEFEMAAAWFVFRNCVSPIHNRVFTTLMFWGPIRRRKG